jgi:hypothetical protein
VWWCAGDGNIYGLNFIFYVRVVAAQIVFAIIGYGDNFVSCAAGMFPGITKESTSDTGEIVRVVQRLQIQDGADIWNPTLFGTGLAVYRDEHHVHVIFSGNVIQMDILP